MCVRIGPHYTTNYFREYKSLVGPGINLHLLLWLGRYSGIRYDMYHDTGNAIRYILGYINATIKCWLEVKFQ